jgi:pimeloyl-ACP methyl ester carboxylesterase
MTDFQDDIKRPSPLLLLMESRALLELGAYFAFVPLLKTFESLPKGDGHPVLVLPGFIASDVSTTLLRNFLGDLGYEAFPWRLGRNLADYDQLEMLMNERVKWLRKRYLRKVSLIGWSLGGVYAREIARAMPNDIRQVITLGSPFRGIGKENNANWAYELIHGKSVRDIDDELVKRVCTPPPVPTTAIFTRTDGIVNWETCVENPEGPITENIEVLGSHCGLGHNPMVLMHIAERLAQPEGEWQPYKEKLKQKTATEGFAKNFAFV